MPAVHFRADDDLKLVALQLRAQDARQLFDFTLIDFVIVNEIKA